MSQIELNGLYAVKNNSTTAHQQAQKTGTENRQQIQQAADPVVQKDMDSVDKAMKEANDALKTLRRDERQFAVDEDLEKLIVKIVNSDTKELIRQIPTEEVLNLSKRMIEVSELLYGSTIKA